MTINPETSSMRESGGLTTEGARRLISPSGSTACPEAGWRLLTYEFLIALRTGILDEVEAGAGMATGGNRPDDATFD